MQRWTLSLLPLALTACTPTDQPAEKDSADTAPVDEDLDGHSPPDDCDDQNGAVNPDGAEACNGGTSAVGAAYLVLGGASGELSASAAPITLRGTEPWGYAGHAVSPGGDADGDGLADVLVGAPGDWSEGVFEGAAYLVLGGVSGVVDLAAADAVTTGDARSDGFGASLASGDHDGDGRPDVAFGAPGTGSYGGASLRHGPPTW